MNAAQPETRLFSDAVEAMRAKIARFGALLYQRQLTDAAGGNLSARVEDLLVMSPRYAGSKHQWALRPEQVLVVTLDGRVLAGGGDISREAKVHLKLHQEFREHGTGVIHAHARNVLVFAALGVPMPPVLEATRKFGEVPVIEFAPSHTADLAERVAAAIGAQTEKIAKQAAGVIAPWHGVFVMGKNIDHAFDAVERLDVNAYCILMGELLKKSDLLNGERARLEAACRLYEHD